MEYRYICEACGAVIEPDDRCDCTHAGVIQQRQCPTCWEYRCHTEYEDGLSCCEGCTDKAKTFVRFGIVAPDETLLDTYHETVRFRNMTKREDVPVTRIELYKGELVAEIRDRARTPLRWEQSELCWYVLDDIDPLTRREDART